MTALVEEPVPPQPRRNDDDRSIGELVRTQEAILEQVRGLAAKFDGLSTTYTPREVYDLGIGGVKIDIRRIDEENTKTDGKITALEAEINKRFRQSVTLTISAIIGPVTVALILYVLSQVAAR